MSRIFVGGYGAVSPAGWSAGDLLRAVERGEPLPVQPLERPGWARPLRVREVPAPAIRPAFLAHPRLRRASPITQYAAGAMLEALSGLPANPNRPVGVVVCLQSGCVQYTCRFFEEAVANPITASPLLFPETVFAAPASHLAAQLENPARVSTLLGDPATFAQGLMLGAQWLREGSVDVAVVVGAEETNWLRADALWHLEHTTIVSSGAAAVALCREAVPGHSVELDLVTRPRSYSARWTRSRAVAAVRADLGERAGELLCDGLGDSPRADAPEAAGWRNWTGPRVSPKKILGEGLVAAAAWQCVIACAAVAEQKYSSAMVSLVGCNQQAAGVRFQATVS